MRASQLVANSYAFANSSLFSLSRACTTVDELGVQVPANTPRFGKNAAVAGQLGDAEDVLTGMGGTPYCFVGLSVAQKPLLVALENSGSDRRIRVLSEDTPSVWTTRTDYTFTKQTSGAGGSSIGDVRGKMGTANDDGLCYVPKAWCIVHGAIVAFCEVLYRTAGTGTVWTTSEVRGCGFAVSNDYGATFQYSYDDTVANFNPGKARLSGWSMCSYFVPFHDPSQPLLEAWIGACDYQTAGVPPAAAPHGGTVYWFKMTRATADDNFVPVNVSDTITVGRDNIDITSVNDSLKYCQRQGFALAKDTSTPNTLIGLVAESDGQWSSITKITGIDRYDYASGTHTSQRNWQGFIDTSVQLNSGHDTFTGNMTSGSAVISVATLAATWGNKLAPYNNLLGTMIRVAGAGAAGADLIAPVTAFNEGAATITLSTNASSIVVGATCTIQIRGDKASGNQFVGACMGPEDGEVILGGDAAIGTLDLVQANDTICTHRRLWSGHTDERSVNDTTVTSTDYASWGCQRIFIAQLKVERPELATRVIVATNNRTTQMGGTAGPEPANVNTLLISRDSGRPGTWASVRHPDDSSVYTPDSIGLHVIDNKLYTFTASSIKRYVLPGTVAGRPLLVSPGTVNHMRENFGGTNGGYDSDTPNNFVRCPKVNGKFQRVAITGDGSGQVQGTSLGDLDPQPPIQHDPADANSGNVYRVRTGTLTNGTALPLANASNTVATFPIVTRGSDSEFVGTIGMGAALGTSDYYKVRVFMLNATNLPESSTIARGKSPCNSFMMLRANPYGGGALAFTGPTFQQCSNDEWDAIRITRQVTGGPWNTNAAGGSAMLLQLLQGAGNDRVDNDIYVAFDQFSTGKGCYGYPQPRGASGATANNVVVVPATNPNEIAVLNGISVRYGTSFTFVAVGCVPKYCWDHFTYRNSTDTEWPVLTLAADASNYITFAPSPWSTTNPSNVIDREGRLRITINDAGSPTVKEQTSATFLSGESMIIVVRYNATTNVVTIDSVIAGQRMATQTYTATGWAGKRFDRVLFGNVDGTVVSSFAWFTVASDDGEWTDSQVSERLISMDFASSKKKPYWMRRGR